MRGMKLRNLSVSHSRVSLLTAGSTTGSIIDRYAFSHIRSTRRGAAATGAYYSQEISSPTARAE